MFTYQALRGRGGMGLISNIVLGAFSYMNEPHAKVNLATLDLQREHQYFRMQLNLRWHLGYLIS